MPTTTKVWRRDSEESPGCWVVAYAIRRGWTNPYQGDAQRFASKAEYLRRAGSTGLFRSRKNSDAIKIFEDALATLWESAVDDARAYLEAMGVAVVFE